MNRVLGTVIVAIYILLCFGALGVWLPNFLFSNWDFRPEFSVRYLAATALPFGMLLVTVIARQALKGYFSIVMFSQVLMSGVALYAGLIAFNYERQADFFCAVHLALCVLSIAWNVYQHRRELARHHAAEQRPASA